MRFFLNFYIRFLILSLTIFISYFLLHLKLLLMRINSWISMYSFYDLNKSKSIYIFLNIYDLFFFLINNIYDPLLYFRNGED